MTERSVFRARGLTRGSRWAAMGMRARAVLAVAAGAVAVLGSAGAARAQTPSVPGYTLVGSFPLAADSWDLLPDGRAVRIVGNQLSVQSAVNSGTFVPAGTIQPGLVSGFGASFVRVNAATGEVAVGDNNFGAQAQNVLVFSSAVLTTGAEAVSGASPLAAVASPNSDATWDGAGRLYVTGAGAQGSVLTRVDLTRAGGATTGGSATTVISSIGDGSGGVAIHGGRLFTGVGFSFAGPAGEIRAFDLAMLETASAAVGFSSGGGPVTRVLSAGSLGFDRFGNLLVGGGDGFTAGGDTGFAAVVDAGAVAAALAGGGPAGVTNQLRLSPAGTTPFFYGVRFNAATDELWVSARGTVYRYAVPGPGAAGLAVMGVVAVGRRRRCSRGN